MRTIVAPVDGSARSTLALRTAFSVARRAGASVRLVHVATDGRSAMTHEDLARLAERFADLADWTVEVVDDADPVDGIVATAAAGDTITCLPTRSRTGLSRMLLGSVTEGVVRRSGSPTLCVGPGTTTVAMPEERITVLIATDDSPASPIVLEAAAGFCTSLGASAVVAQVVGPDEDIGPTGAPPPRPLGERAHRHTTEAAAWLGERGVPAASAVLPGRPAASLVSHAHEFGAAFIVVGTTDLTGLDRITLGSVAAAVVGDAPCPVLVVPTRDRAALRSDA